MEKFTFIVPPLMGHVNPTLALGTELIRRGHAVSWISPDESLAARLPAGGLLQLIRYEGDREKEANLAQLDSIYKKSVYGAESIKFLYDEVLLPLNRYMFSGIMEHIDRFGPDVIINDHQAFAGAVAAVRKGIPYATSITAPAAINAMEELPVVHEWEVGKIVGLQQELGLEGGDCVACSDDMALVFTSREFFGETRLPGHYHFVGPAIQNRPQGMDACWAGLLSRRLHPRVLVSIGTTFDHQYKKDFFARVIAALGGEDLTVVVVSDPALFETWPANFIVRSSIPQLALLPHLDAVVCHGGHNTVCEALLHGLPLVVIPIAYDQSYVASRVTAAGSGMRLNFKRFKSGDLKQGVHTVLYNRSYEEGAARIQASFERAGGAGRAAGLLERQASVARTSYIQKR